VAQDDVVLWRIAKKTPDYAADDLSGGGAAAVGGRWNRKGTAAVYASTTIALATLETLARLGGNIAIRNAFLVRIDIPHAVWATRRNVSLASLPPAWLAEPAGSASMDVGDAWLRAQSHCLLLVPSIIVPEECNVVINPAHPAAVQLRARIARQHVYDPRFRSPAPRA
jgi:RES domain-containing protein